MKTKTLLLVLFFQFVNLTTQAKLPLNCGCEGGLEAIRNLAIISKEQLVAQYPSLGALYNLTFVGNHKLAYTLEEFIALSRDRKSTRLNSSHSTLSRMPSSA